MGINELITSLAKNYRCYEDYYSKGIVHLNEQRKIRLAEKFLGLSVITSEHHSDACRRTGFSTLIDYTKQGWNEFLIVIDDPSFVCWLSIWEELLQPYRSYYTNSLQLNSYFPDLSDDGKINLLNEHLLQFGVFTLSIAWLRKEDFLCPQAFFWKYRGLPATDTEWQLPIDRVPSKLIGLRGSTLEGIDVYGNRYQIKKIRPVPVVRHKCLSIKVQTYSPYYHIRNIERWDRLEEFRDLEKFAADFQSALYLIDSIFPGLLSQAKELVSNFIPMTTHGTTPMASGSFSRLFGAIFVNTSSSDNFNTEMFIHEFCHHKISLIEEFAELFPGNGVRKFIYYSPWRDSLRSAEGVLHALFVHSEINRFWIHLLDSTRDSIIKDIAYRRVLTLITQLKWGLNDLKEQSEFNSISTSIFNEIENLVNLWSCEYKITDKFPFFSELKQNSHLYQLPISQAIAKHRQQVWKTASNPSIVPRDLRE